MRIAVFSDIHGNYTGLRAVLAAITACGGADRVIAAGDHIGGHSGGDDLLELLLRHQVQLIRGDSDTVEKLVRLAQEHHTTPEHTPHRQAYYHRMLAWYHQYLSETNRALLAALPFAQTVAVAPDQHLYVCHASPQAINDRICAPHTDPATIRAAYRSVDAAVCAYGHWHNPYVRWLDQRLYVNVASVGLRSDGLSRFTLLTYHDAHWVVEQHAVPYDHHVEDARMRAREVPRWD